MSALDEALALIKRWAHVGSNEECWPYRLASFVKSGNGACVYGRVIISGKRQRAHRASYEAFFGGIPPGLFVCHSCDNPLCCNPSHLFLGTAADNNFDKMAKGRHRTALGLDNGQAKLSDAHILAIAEAAVGGENYRTIAERYGISRSMVSMIRHGKTRKHILGAAA